MERAGLIFLDHPSTREQVELVRHAEESGFKSAPFCEAHLSRKA